VSTPHPFPCPARCSNFSSFFINLLNSVLFTFVVSALICFCVYLFFFFFHYQLLNSILFPSVRFIFEFIFILNSYYNLPLLSLDTLLQKCFFLKNSFRCIVPFLFVHFLQAKLYWWSNDFLFVFRFVVFISIYWNNVAPSFRDTTKLSVSSNTFPSTKSPFKSNDQSQKTFAALGLDLLGHPMKWLSTFRLTFF
jgi:hypothetical protein